MIVYGEYGYPNTVYEMYTLSNGEIRYLCGDEITEGLRVLAESGVTKSEEFDPEKEGFIKIKETPFSSARYVHPVLYEARRGDWERYNEIVEGYSDGWVWFKEQLLQHELSKNESRE